MVSLQIHYTIQVASEPVFIDDLWDSSDISLWAGDFRILVILIIFIMTGTGPGRFTGVNQLKPGLCN